MLSGPFGFIAFLAILYATFMFLKCIISATFKYVISTVLVAFLLSLTPLFIVFILFQKTKPLFDNWIKTLAHVSLEPVILFSFLSLLNQLMYSVLYNLTNFSACYQCLISVNFLSYDLCLMKSILPLGYSPGTSVDVALSTGERAGGHFAALPIDLIRRLYTSLLPVQWKLLFLYRKLWYKHYLALVMELLAVLVQLLRAHRKLCCQPLALMIRPKV